MSVLPVDDGELARCVSCGLCLPHCPTWRVTGREMASPRGRIAAMRAVQWDGAPLSAEFERMMEECVQCRGCEPPCPAFVPFGRLMEGAREALSERRRRPWWEAVGLRLVLPRHWLLLTLTWVLLVAQRLHLVRLPFLDQRSLRTPLQPSAAGSGEPVVLFTGCVMDAWMRDTHRAAIRVIEAAGGAVSLPGSGGACCGALHLHAGRIDDARRLAERVIAAVPEDRPVLVDSAGCGAVMKDYGRLLGSREAQAFSARVVDVHEWLVTRPLPLGGGRGRVVVQDPCHLRHAQHADGTVREVLRRCFEVVETADGGLCCGAGGSYSLTQPALARDIRDRKAAALVAAGGPDPLVASANPGCAMHLARGGLRVRHPVELLAEALEVPSDD